MCGLMYWREEEVWCYIGDKELAYNELDDENYGSIGWIACR
ncbi:phosphoadenosine phosphosulfate reductase domain-containing protein [Staphylococcus epidermidis]